MLPPRQLTQNSKNCKEGIKILLRTLICRSSDMFELTDKGRQTQLNLGRCLLHLYVHQLRFLPDMTKLNIPACTASIPIEDLVLVGSGGESIYFRELCRIETSMRSIKWAVRNAPLTESLLCTKLNVGMAAGQSTAKWAHQYRCWSVLLKVSNYVV